MAVKDVALLNLGDAQADPIDWAQYETAKETNFAPPPEGRYTFQVPTEFEFDTADVDGRKVLVVKVDPLTIVNHPSAAGYQVKFTRLTTKKFGNRMGSPVGDYLRSAGVAAEPKTLAEYGQLVAATANRFLQARLTHRGYCKECAHEVKGADFGGQTKINCPTCHKPIYANGQIAPWDFIPAAGQ